MIYVFLCIHSFTLIKEIMERISPLPSVNVVGLTTVLPVYASVFHEANIDVLFLDCTSQMEEAIALGRLIQQESPQPIKIVYLLKEMNEITKQLIREDVIQYYLCYPFGVDCIIRMISEEVGKTTRTDVVHHNSKESLMVLVLQSLGLPVHLQGYTFLKSASMLILDSPKEIHMSMKRLYKEVARMHTTTITRVEKSIRTAIDFAYRVAPQKIAMQGKKPTNSQVIHYVSEQVHLLEIEQKEEVKG